MRRSSLSMVLGMVLVISFVAMVGPDEARGAVGFIERSGSRLILDGADFRFTGLNIYNANSDGTCGSAVDLDQALTDIGTGKAVMRAWFFQDMATSGGSRDWSRMDQTLSKAADHGVKVIPVLANQWADCDSGYGFKTKAWYQSGYKDPDPAGTVSYRDWVAEIVNRYKDDPSVAFWQLGNEVEIQDVEFGDCSLVTDAAETLRSWAEDVAGLIKSIDANHMVSLGTIGGGQCGTQGAEYEYVHSLPDIDLCEYHDYGSPLTPLPGDQFNGFEVRVQQCLANLGKPLFIGESGIIPEEVGGLLERADAFAAKLAAQFSVGAVGFLAWAYVDPPTPGTFDIGAGDPTLSVLTLTTPEGTLTDLGTLGGTYSWAVAISDDGQVVGASTTSSAFQPHAFSWTKEEGMIDLGTLGGASSSALAVNSSGQVVGHSLTASGERHAFIWTAASGMVDLGTLGGNRSFAVALNENGQVAGVSTTATGDDHAFLWTSTGGMTDIGTLGGAFSRIGWTWFSASGTPAGPALNDSGQVVGWSETATGEVHAFLWADGEIHDLGTLGDEHSFALAMNASGQTVGVGRFPQHAFLWAPASGMTDLGTLGGETSEAISINDSTEVAGNSTNSAGNPRGFFWAPQQGMVDLGSLGGGSSEVGGSSAVSLPGGPVLSESGQVVGQSTTTTGDIHAFSWTMAGGMVDLGTLGGDTSGAFAVNGQGQVVGISDTSSGDFHGFLWDPPQSGQDPITAIGALIDQVQSLGTKGALKTSLTGKLEAALRTLSDSNPANDTAAVRSLQAFILEVRAQRGRGIDVTNADELISTATEIIVSLPGSSG